MDVRKPRRTTYVMVVVAAGMIGNLDFPICAFVRKRDATDYLDNMRRRWRMDEVNCNHTELFDVGQAPNPGGWYGRAFVVDVKDIDRLLQMYDEHRAGVPGATDADMVAFLISKGVPHVPRRRQVAAPSAAAAPIASSSSSRPLPVAAAADLAASAPRTAYTMVQVLPHTLGNLEFSICAFVLRSDAARYARLHTDWHGVSWGAVVYYVPADLPPPGGWFGDRRVVEFREMMRFLDMAEVGRDDAEKAAFLIGTGVPANVYMIPPGAPIFAAPAAAPSAASSSAMVVCNVRAGRPLGAGAGAPVKKGRMQRAHDAAKRARRLNRARQRRIADPDDIVVVTDTDVSTTTGYASSSSDSSDEDSSDEYQHSHRRLSARRRRQ